MRQPPRSLPPHQFAGPGLGAQALAQFSQQLVASVVPQGVVEVLEAIQINDEQGDLRPAIAGRLETLAKPGCKGAPVYEARQRIGLRQPERQLTLGLQFRDACGEFSQVIGKFRHRGRSGVQHKTPASPIEANARLSDKVYVR